MPEKPPNPGEPMHPAKDVPRQSAKVSEQRLVEAQIEKARRETIALKKGKKIKREMPDVSPEEAKKLMEAAFRDPQARKEFARLVGRPDMVPEDPRAQAILTHIASAPSALRQDPDWLVMQGNRLRETLRADMPGAERNKIAAALRTMYRDVVGAQGIDMSNPAIRASRDPVVREKVQFAELAGNILLPEAGQVPMPDSGGGDAEEFKVEAPEFTLVKDPSELDSLQPDLKKELEGIQGVFENDDLARGDEQFIKDQIKSLRNIAKNGPEYAKEAQTYLKRLERQLTDIQTTRREVFGKGDVIKLEAEATRYQQQLDNARNRFLRNYNPVEGNENDVTKIQSGELSQIVGRLYDSSLSSGELEALQSSLTSLRSRTMPDLSDPNNPKLLLPDLDKPIANDAAEWLAVKRQFASFMERNVPRMNDEALRYFFRHLNYKDSEVDWIFTTMNKLHGTERSPGLLERLGIDSSQRNLEFSYDTWRGFEKDVEKHFNIMFKAVHENPSGAWEEWFTMFYHRPAYQTFMERLSGLRTELLETYGNTAGENQPHIARQINGRRTVVTLQELVNDLYEKMRSSYDFQEYCHNAFYILTTRGDLKTLAGYANRLRSDMIDYAFSDEKVQAAYHYYEQILRHELGWNQWRANPTWFIFIKEPGGLTRVERITDRVERLMREHFSNVKEDWDIRRAMSIARGSLFGVTNVGIDLLGEADAPMAGVRWSSYFGERLLITWNVTRHFFYRWWPSKAEKYMPLLYNKMYRAFTGRPWDPDKLKKWHDEHHSDRLTSQRQYKGGVLPFIQQSNWLKVGGPETRSGWRLRASIERIFSKLPLRNDEFHNFAFENFEPHHFEESRRELEKTGLNYLYFWAETLDTKLLKEKPPKGVSEAQWKAKQEMVKTARLTLEDVYRDILHKDPLFFITRDSTLWDPKKMVPGGVTFEHTIRGRAAKLLGGEWSRLVDDIIDPIAGTEKTGEGLVSAETRVNMLRERLDQIEEDLMKVTEVMVKHNQMRWTDKVTEELAKILPRERLNLAKKYYDAVIKVVTTEETKMTWESKETGFKERTDRVTFLEEFAKRTVPYTVGTVTKNWEVVSEAGGEAGGGQSVTARALDDALKMSEGVVNPMLYFNYKLDDLIDSNGDFSEIDKYLKTAREAITYVHGQFGEYDRFSHDFNELILRNFQKAWWARLPFGIGNTSSVLVPAFTSWRKRDGKLFRKYASNSQRMAENPMLMAFDEQRLYTRIRHLIDINLLTPAQGALLMQEMGATGGAMVYDMIRSYFPWVAGLAVVAGFTTARKDQEEK